MHPMHTHKKYFCHINAEIEELIFKNQQEPSLGWTEHHAKVEFIGFCKIALSFSR